MDDSASVDFYHRLTELAKRKRLGPTSETKVPSLRGDKTQAREEIEQTKKSSGPPIVEDNQKRQDGLGPVDVAIITALRDPEFDQVLKVFDCDWQPSGQQNVIFQTGQLKADDHNLTVVAACQNTMGMVAASLLTQKTITIWRPRIVIMTGICASVPDKSNLGDVIVGKQVFDYGSGKIHDGILKPDYTPLEMFDILTNYLTEIAYDNGILQAIRSRWPIAAGKPDTELKAHIGPFCSGAAVVADDSIVMGITEHKRSVIGIDMEAYGVAMACMTSSSHRIPFIIAKSVQDYANTAKNDDYRHYAAFTSANFIREFLLKHWKDIAESL